jgi:alanine racemase
MMITSRCWAEISIEAIRHNIRVVRSMVAPRVRLVMVVKADAYGHGLGELAARLDDAVDLFGVANLEEANVIRASGARAAILILGPALPGERPKILEGGFIPMVSTFEEAAAYAENVREGEQFEIHFVIDTGMGRIGLWHEEAVETLQAIRRLPQIHVTALSSHLPVADTDPEYTRTQLERFKKGISDLGVESVTVLNSAGVLRFGNWTKPGDLVRAGLVVYGVSPIEEFQKRVQPALNLKSRVGLVRSLGAGRNISYGRTYLTTRPTKVATLCAGYGDGLAWQLSGHDADVLIQGTRCTLLGRVTMDQIMVDVTHLENVVPGEEAVLIGRQGAEEILATELAEKAGTIAWEILTRITKRVDRIYV